MFPPPPPILIYIDINMIDEQYKLYEKTRLDILNGGMGKINTNRDNVDRKKINTVTSPIGHNMSTTSNSSNPFAFLKSPEKSISNNNINNNNNNNTFSASQIAANDIYNNARPTTVSLLSNSNIDINTNNKQKSMTFVTEKDSKSLWESFLSDLPYHRGDGPFQYICDSCLLSLKIESILWNHIFPMNIPKAVKSFSVVAAKIINSLIITFPSILLQYDDTNNNTDIISSHKTNSIIASTSISANNNNFSLLRQVNIMLCHLDILDIYLTNSDDFRNILLKSVLQRDVVDETVAGASLLEIRKKFLNLFFKSCDYLLKSKWEYVEMNNNNNNNNSSSSSSIVLSMTVTRSNQDNENNRMHLTSSSSPALTCDVHSMTVAIVHCCKGLSTFSESIYDNQIIPLATQNKIKIPIKATSIRLLILTLIDNLMQKLTILGTKLNPSDMTKRIRLLETGHAKYNVNDNEALQCLKWAQIHLFNINNYFAILSYITEIKNEWNHSQRINYTNNNIRYVFI